MPLFSQFLTILVPLLFCAVLIYGLVHQVDVFASFVKGAKEGLKTAVSIFPTLIAITTCIGMFTASGGLDLLTHLLAPLVSPFPQEILPLALIRPISGSGAMVLFQDILKTYGADSRIGEIAAVLLGSSETTFYTTALYFSAVKVHKTSYTIPCCLAADLAGFLASALTVSLLLK